MFARTLGSVAGSFHKRTPLPAIVCIALAACGGTPTRATPPAAVVATAGRVPAYVVKRAWHVDIGVALTDVRPPLLPVAAAYQASRYLLFGFGDRGYVLHGSVGDMVAALWGAPGLVMVTSLTRPQPEDVFGEDSVVRLALTPEQMGELQAFIGHTFATHDGAIIPVTPGPPAGSGYSAYYESAQRYSALYTCNTWAAEALKAAELPVNSSGVEFAGQLWQQVRRLENAGAERASEVQPGGTPTPTPRP